MNYDSLPRHADSIRRYVEDGIPMGGFLTAVFANDLLGAVGRADAENQHLLRDYAVWIYNESPSQCHGSRERVNAWIKQGGTSYRAPVAT